MLRVKAVGVRWDLNVLQMYWTDWYLHLRGYPIYLVSSLLFPIGFVVPSPWD